MFLTLKRPKYWFENAVERSEVGEMRNASPLLLREEISESIAKTKVVEKERGLPDEDLKRRGVG